MHFEIQDHRVTGLPFRPSPFADERPVGAQPELIVVHGISLPPREFGGPHVDELFFGRLDPAAHPYFSEVHTFEVSAHVFVRRDGSAIQYVPFNRRAWHAGKSNWCGRERCNDFSIGIELEGTDDTPYTRAQYVALAALIEALQRAYPTLNDDTLAGHCDIAPGRKTDPGPSFDWAELRDCLAERRAGC